MITDIFKLVRTGIPYKQETRINITQSIGWESVKNYFKIFKHINGFCYKEVQLFETKAASSAAILLSRIISDCSDNFQFMAKNIMIRVLI